jgi:phosphoglycerate kinase
MTSLADLDVAGKRIFLRCDLNVPLKEGKITDDGRIRASLPTINLLLAKGASIVIAAHLGRPKGEPKPELSLAPVSLRLAELLGKPVHFAAAITGDEVRAKAQALAPGEILLLENIRFSAAETSKDEAERAAFAAELASLAEFYVGDGFGAVHRKHASVFDLPKILPHAAGTLVAAEVEVLKKLTVNPERPYGVVLGGSKVSDKIGVISNLLGKVDVMAIGGGMLFTFLAAQGKEIGTSLVERDLIDTVKELIHQAESTGVKLLLPTDIVVAPTFAADAKPTLVSADQIPTDQMGLDIGPETASKFAEAIKGCKTVFWNGPMESLNFQTLQRELK